MSDISEIVKKLREQLGWNQSDLIDRTGLGKTTIQTIESGTNDNPQYKTLVTIFETMGVDNIPLNIDNFKADKRTLLVNGILNGIGSFLKLLNTGTLEIIHDTIYFVLDKIRKTPRG